jgi:hypothetical protein
MTIIAAARAKKAGVRKPSPKARLKIRRNAGFSDLYSRC